MPSPHYIGRFAPSPTGPLHLGSAMTALASWLLARQAGGQWLLRIEDIDPPRQRAGAIEQQLRQLAALGLVPDAPALYQSRCSARYARALQRLLDSGLAFVCHCSRSDLAAQGGVHRHCVRGRGDGPGALRLHVPEATEVHFHDRLQGEQRQALDREVGDFVLRRADGLWAYQLAVVVDDAAQQVTEVVRGADLLDSTPRQIFLQRALGLPTPDYCHLPLLVDTQGEKLSKSEGAQAVDEGTPLATLERLWALLGQRPDARPGEPTVAQWLRTAVARFDLAPLAGRRHIEIAAHAAGAADVRA